MAERRVGVAVDFSACSKEALRWAVENVVRDGDHLILVNVQKEGVLEGGETQLWEATGSREFVTGSSPKNFNIFLLQGSFHQIRHLNCINFLFFLNDLVFCVVFSVLNLKI